MSANCDSKRGSDRRMRHTRSNLQFSEPPLHPNADWGIAHETRTGPGQTAHCGSVCSRDRSVPEMNQPSRKTIRDISDPTEPAPIRFRKNWLIFAGSLSHAILPNSNRKLV